MCVLEGKVFALVFVQDLLTINVSTLICMYPFNHRDLLGFLCLFVHVPGCLSCMCGFRHPPGAPAPL